jgi:MHS family citrate/tricarballylate:H+ symporter-like MFS transporter
MVVALTELVDKSTRTIGFALAYSLATAIYGGFTPIIATSLIHLSNNNAMPGLWISIAAICSCIAVLMMAKRNLKNY